MDKASSYTAEEITVDGIIEQLLSAQRSGVRITKMVAIILGEDAHGQPVARTYCAGVTRIESIGMLYANLWKEAEGLWKPAEYGELEPDVANETN